MVYKTWNVRDQPKETLERQLEKKFCNEIELELLRRSWNNGTTS